MSKRQWLKKRRKRRKKTRRVLEKMAVTTNSDVITLASGYGLSIYWSNEIDSYIVELDDFGQKFHTDSIANGVNFALEANKLLITEYRTRGMDLPSVG